MKYYNIPIFISHLGCPNTCVFCNQNKIAGIVTDMTSEKIENTINEYLKTLPENSIKELAFFGGTFTGLPINTQKEFLQIVQKYIKENKINGIRLSTRPDYINEEIIDMLLKYNVKTIELGVQSFDNLILGKSERGYIEEDIFKASNLIKNSGIKLGIQIMPGLPASNLETNLDDTKKILKIMPDLVRIYPTLVISGTKLEKMYLNNEYTPLSIEEAINTVKKMIALLELSNIKIIRVGLQPSEDLREEGVIIAGPFHPAFRELVESEIYYDFFSNKLREYKELEILINEKRISRAVGMKKSNLKKLSGKLNIKMDNSLELDKIIVNSVEYNRQDLLKNLL